MALVSSATITNNNFAAPGDTITNNNDSSGDRFTDIVLKAAIGEDHDPEMTRSRKFSKAQLAKHPKVKSESDCPYGTQINNNQGKKEIFCLREFSLIILN